jgi:hypothetical protein
VFGTKGNEIATDSAARRGIESVARDLLSQEYDEDAIRDREGDP